VNSVIPVVAYERERHESAFIRFTEKVLGADICARRQRIIDTFHDHMPGRERLPLRYILLDGESVAGTLGYMPADFLVNGEIRPARYTHDLLVDPAYTGRMLGKRIIVDTFKKGDFFPGGMWMTYTCYRLHLLCGFEEAPPLTTFTSVLDPAAFLARRRLSPLKSAAARLGLEAVSAIGRKRARHVLSRASAAVDAVARFDPRFDAAWLDLARGYGVARVRDATYLNWKYTDHPVLDYRIVMATDNGRPRGFLVWRPAPEGSEETRAVIADFLVARGDERTLKEMVARVIVDASSSGVPAVAIMTTQPWAQAALRAMGFLPGRIRNKWVVGGWRDVMPPDWLKDMDRWHMCIGDSDGDMWTGSM
jgi:hypothetical protein